MNYQANEIKWAKGDIVVHDADAKEPKMLMKVIGFTRDGLAKTQYCSTVHRRKIWVNGLEFLHEPEQFGIQSVWGTYRQDLQESVQRQFMRVKHWNAKFAEETPVLLMWGNTDIPAKTKSKAYMDASGNSFIYIVDKGNWSLDLLVPNQS